MTIALNASNHNANNIVIGGLGTSRMKLTRLHIKLGLDITGSTGPFNTGVNAIFADLVTELPLRVGEFHIGLHAGKDMDHDTDHDVNLGDDLPAGEIIKQLGLIQYAGGGDELETQIDSALLIGRTTAWKTSLARHSGGESMVLSNTPSADELKRIRDRLIKSVTQIAGAPASGTVGIAPAPKFGSSGTVALGA